MTIEVPRALSKLVFDDGLTAAQNSDHPCHGFIGHQAAQGCPLFQLPEPFSGRYSDLHLVIVGKNPGLTPDEFYPVNPIWSFEEYDAFFRSRFDWRAKSGNSQAHLLGGQANRPDLDRHQLEWKEPEFWAGCERFGRRLMPGFRLGTHGIILETIRYKSKDGWIGNSARETRGILQHESAITRQLLTELRPTVLIASGKDALHMLHDLIGLRPLPPSRLGDAYGRNFRLEDTGAHVVAVKHLSYGMKTELATAAVAQVRAALEQA